VAIRTPDEVASPQASEKRAKSASPAMKTRRLPSRSPRRPPSRRKPPKVSAYPLTTHSNAPVEKWSCFWIDGRATFTIDTSSTTIK
jgi:hypothetical protein